MRRSPGRSARCSSGRAPVAAPSSSRYTDKTLFTGTDEQPGDRQPPVIPSAPRKRPCLRRTEAIVTRVFSSRTSRPDGTHEETRRSRRCSQRGTFERRCRRCRRPTAQRRGQPSRCEQGGSGGGRTFFICSRSSAFANWAARCRCGCALRDDLRDHQIQLMARARRIKLKLTDPFA